MIVDNQQIFPNLPISPKLPKKDKKSLTPLGQSPNHINNKDIIPAHWNELEK